MFSIKHNLRMLTAVTCCCCCCHPVNALDRQNTSTIITGFFVTFVIGMIIFHCYLKRQQRKRIRIMIMRSTYNHINRRGMIVEMPMDTFVSLLE